MIKVIINGEEKEIEANTTIQSVISSLNMKTNMLVVEKNLEIVPKGEYDSSYLLDGDKIEIVSFFGGG